MKSGRGSRCVTHSECTALGETERKYIFFFFLLFLSLVYIFKICGVYIVNLSVTILFVKKKKKKKNAT